MLKSITSLGLIFTCLCVVACSYGSRQNFAKIPETSFLPQPLQYVGKPFDGEWRLSGHKAVQGDLYIKIAPVSVAPPLSDDDPHLVEAARHLAKRFEYKLKSEFAELEPYRIFLVEEAPKGKCLLTIECALLDLHVTNYAGNLAGQAAGFCIPGASFIAGLFDKGHITFAAKFFADDELVTEFATCDKTPLSIVGSINDYSAWGNQRSSIDQWAHTIAMDVKNFADGKRVSGSHRIQLFSLYTEATPEEEQ